MFLLDFDRLQRFRYIKQHWLQINIQRNKTTENLDNRTQKTKQKNRENRGGVRQDGYGYGCLPFN